ncbi:hypothetical protein BDZ90DRAFT_228443 [Jaminaea rosea]|uniref:Uncharacterized protein n=1 Tax=Jaminaea rosea TaxID=1569628 RepID=A0A316UJF1_9BASI|nr:hypothetical protein BDZ90DRAFT_228443 [Jaminaea rosea]PWN25417.1 hypothetical protein BDZ90DRAFT_228443 [Jaminaea rosea]
MLRRLHPRMRPSSTATSSHLQLVPATSAQQLHNLHLDLRRARHVVAAPLRHGVGVARRSPADANPIAPSGRRAARMHLADWAGLRVVYLILLSLPSLPIPLLVAIMPSKTLVVISKTKRDPEATQKVRDAAHVRWLSALKRWASDGRAKIMASHPSRRALGARDNHPSPSHHHDQHHLDDDAVVPGSRLDGLTRESAFVLGSSDDDDEGKEQQSTPAQGRANQRAQPPPDTAAAHFPLPAYTPSLPRSLGRANQRAQPPPPQGTAAASFPLPAQGHSYTPSVPRSLGRANQRAHIPSGQAPGSASLPAQGRAPGSASLPAQGRATGLPPLPSGRASGATSLPTGQAPRQASLPSGRADGPASLLAKGRAAGQASLPARRRATGAASLSSDEASGLATLPTAGFAGLFVPTPFDDGRTEIKGSDGKDALSFTAAASTASTSAQLGGAHARKRRAQRSAASLAVVDEDFAAELDDAEDDGEDDFVPPTSGSKRKRGPAAPKPAAGADDASLPADSPSNQAHAGSAVASSSKAQLESGEAKSKAKGKSTSKAEDLPDEERTARRERHRAITEASGRANTRLQAIPLNTGFSSLAEHKGRPLEVLPRWVRPVPDCVPYGDAVDLRSQPGPLPAGISPPTGPPAREFATLIWRALEYDDRHNSYTPEEIRTHIAKAACPTIGEGSVAGTPEHSSDEYDGEGDADGDDGASPRRRMTHTIVLPLRTSIEFDGRTESHDTVTIVVEKTGRPWFVVKLANAGRTDEVRLGFGHRPSNAPGPLPRLRSFPRAVKVEWHASVSAQKRAELASDVETELDIWRGLLGSFNAAADEEELDLLINYLLDIKASYTNAVSRCPASVYRGGRELTLKETEADMRVWARPSAEQRGVTKSIRTVNRSECIPDVEKLKCLYNHLAAIPSWWMRMCSHGLLLMAKLILEEQYWLVGHCRDGDIDSCLASISERIGDGDIGAWDVLRFLHIGKKTSGQVLPLLTTETRSKGCPLPGLLSGCYRGSHLPARTATNPNLAFATHEDGRKAPIGSTRTTSSQGRSRGSLTGIWDYKQPGVPGSADRVDLLTAALPDKGFRMTALPDDQNRWMAEVMQHGFDHPTPPPARSIAERRALEQELGLAVDFFGDFDELIASRLPSFFDFRSLVNPVVSLAHRVDCALKAGMPSVDRIASRKTQSGKVVKTSHDPRDGNLQWLSGWANIAKSSDCSHHDDGDRKSKSGDTPHPKVSKGNGKGNGKADEELAIADGGTTEQLLAALRRNKATKEFECPVVAPQTALANLLLTLQASLLARAEVAQDGMRLLQNLLDDLTRWCKYSWRCEDLGAIRPPPPGPLTGDDWEADQETSEVDQDDAEADEELAVADGGTPDQVLAALRRGRGRDVKYPVVAPQTALANLLSLQASLPTDGCPKMACGSSTLASSLNLGPLRPPPAELLKGDEWEADSESEHFKQSLAIGLTPCILYAALAVMSARGQLDKCHLTGLPLKDANVPISIVAHRVHGLPFSSGLRCRPVSRLVEELPGQEQGGKLDEGQLRWRSVPQQHPWDEHVDLFFPTLVTATVRTQLQEVYNDPANLVKDGEELCALKPPPPWHPNEDNREADDASEEFAETRAPLSPLHLPFPSPPPNTTPWLRVVVAPSLRYYYKRTSYISHPTSTIDEENHEKRSDPP